MADLFEFLLLSLSVRQPFLLLDLDQGVPLALVLMIMVSFALRVSPSHPGRQARSSSRLVSRREQRVPFVHTALSRHKRPVRSYSKLRSHQGQPVLSFNRVPWKVNFLSKRACPEDVDLSNPSLRPPTRATAWNQGSSVASLPCTLHPGMNHQWLQTLSMHQVPPTGTTLIALKHTSLLFQLLSHLSELSLLGPLDRLLTPL